jgi:hypothetical protein
MISVMDGVKFVSFVSAKNDKKMTVTLFPNVTVGDAP